MTVEINNDVLVAATRKAIEQSEGKAEKLIQDIFNISEEDILESAKRGKWSHIISITKEEREILGDHRTWKYKECSIDVRPRYAFNDEGFDYHLVVSWHG
jgi:hypothetical protein